MNKKESFLEYLGIIAQMIPASFYWLGLQGRGIKKKLLDVGSDNESNIIGNTVYDIYPHDVTDVLPKDIQDVISTRKESHLENETLDMKPQDQIFLVTSRSNESELHQFCEFNHIKLIVKFLVGGLQIKIV